MKKINLMSFSFGIIFTLMLMLIINARPSQKFQRLFDHDINDVYDEVVYVSSKVGDVYDKLSSFEEALSDKWTFGSILHEINNGVECNGGNIDNVDNVNYVLGGSVDCN